MRTDEIAWLLAVSYANSTPKERTPEEFLADVERAEVDFLSLLQKKEEELINSL